VLVVQAVLVQHQTELLVMQELLGMALAIQLVVLVVLHL
jgi:hypothetical protein